MMKKMPVWLAIVACVCAAGCTSKIHGTATAVAVSGSSSTGSSSPSSPSTSGSPAPSSPSGSSGDQGGGSGDDIAKYRTVDVCSYVRTDAFTKLDKNTKTQVTGGDYTSCFLSVDVPKKAKPADYQLSTAFIDGSDAQTLGTRLTTTLTSSTRSGMTLYSGISKESGCVRALVLNDAVTLSLATRPETAGVTPAQACQVTDATLDSALTVLKDDDASHLRLPADSIVGQDLCTKVGDAAGDLLGGGDPKATPALHGCTWVAGPSASVSLSLSTDSWPPTFPPTGAQTKNFGGRAALISVKASRAGSFSLNEIRMGRSALDSQKYDVITVIASTSDQPAVVRPKVERFLAAVAGLS
ncbi:MAG TPA: hypothetical protein VHC49_25805 [Mycobacteriales bacterium]|nr:hypothetical protein [Mycobacteriales bacterium]